MNLKFLKSINGIDSNESSITQINLLGIIEAQKKYIQDIESLIVVDDK